MQIMAVLCSRTAAVSVQAYLCGSMKLVYVCVCTKNNVLAGAGNKVCCHTVAMHKTSAVATDNNNKTNNKLHALHQRLVFVDFAATLIFCCNYILWLLLLLLLPLASIVFEMWHFRQHAY